MAVDVSRIPNNNKFDPVREAILQLKASIEETGAAIGNGTLTINTSSPLSGSATFTANQVGDTTINIGIDLSDYALAADYLPLTGGTLTGALFGTDLTLSGNLTVSGTTTFIDTTNLNIGDNIITLNADLPSGNAPTENAGIEINRGSAVDVSFLWDETNDRWTLGSNSLLASSFIGNLIGNASTASALATARNIAINGAVTGNANFDGSANITITTTVNHNHDDRYYTETESDARFVNVTGDTMTGNLTVNAILISGGTQAQFLKANGTVTNIDVSVGAPSSSQSSLSYDDATGVFTYTPFSSQGYATIGETNPNFDNDVWLSLYGAPAPSPETTDRFVIANTTNENDNTTTSVERPSISIYRNYEDGFVISTNANGAQTAEFNSSSINLFNNTTISANLTVNGSTINLGDASTDNIFLRGTPSFRTGALILDPNNSTYSTLFYRYAGGHGISAHQIQVYNQYTLPLTDGTAGQVIVTDGDGTLSFADQTGGGGSLTLQDVTDNGATTTNAITVGGLTSTSSITAQSTGYVELKADQTDSAAVRMGVSSASTEGFILVENTGPTHLNTAPILKILGNSGTISEYARFSSTGLEMSGGTTTASVSFPFTGGGLGRIGNYFNSLQLKTNTGAAIEIGGDGPNSVQNDLIVADGNLTVNGGIITGDGSGITNVDAATLDGLDSTSFFIDGDTVLNMGNDDGFVYDDSSNLMYVRIDGVNRLLWHTGNDGAGSGLDADLLDGLHASSFLRNSGTVIHSGLISFTGTGSTSGLRFNSTVVANDAFGIRVNGTSNDGELEFYSTDDDTEPFVFRHYTTGQDGTGASVEWFRIGADGNITAAGTVTASGGNSSNWNDAFGWGDHALAGYLTSIPEATSTVRGGIELFSDTDQAVVANAVSAVAGRTYGLQLNSAGQAVVNVPWTDTNTTYSAGGGLTLSGTTFSHTDTSSQASVNNSNGTVIQDVTLDTYGHVTGLASVDLDGRYYTEAEINRSLAELAGWVPAYSNADVNTVFWSKTHEAVTLKNGASDTSVGMAYKAIRMKAGDVVRIQIVFRGSVADTDGVYFRLYFYNGDLPDGKTHVSNDAAYSFVQEDSSGDTGWWENNAITTSWQNFERTYTAPADGYMSLVVLNWSGYAGEIYIKQPDIQFEKVNQATSANTLTTARTINGVSFNGSANITIEPYVERDDSTNAARYITFVDNNTAGFKRLNMDTSLSYNPSSNVLTVGSVSGSLSGNASTATTLQTARTINGTSFNGSANIVTANWGTARTLTIGNTGKSVNGSANVSWSLSEIGALPLTGGTLTGMLVIDSTAGSGIAYIDSGGTYIPRPTGGSYKTATNAITGAIKITFVGDIPDDMFSFWVDIFDYAGGADGESVSIFISGYAYSNATPFWANCNAVVLSNRTDRDYTVRFGWDGSKHCVTIGETTSTWNYPQVNVRDLQAGYTATYTTFDNSMSVDFVTTLPSIGVTSSDNYVSARTAKTLQTARTISLGGDVTGSASFNGSANITITAAVVDDSHTHDGRYFTESESDGRYVRRDVGYEWTAIGANALSFRSADTIDTASGDQASLEVVQDTAGADAFMQFHVVGDYAKYFGLHGGINDFVVGGWSHGASYQRIFHDGYHPNADTLTTARSINGTNFNGSASITTANWGTARTIWGQSINGGGNITAPVRPAAGSVTAPAFSTSGDTNTGIYFPAADTFAIATAGTRRFQIASTGQTAINGDPVTTGEGNSFFRIVGGTYGLKCFDFEGGEFSSVGRVVLPANNSGVMVVNNGASGQNAFSFRFGASTFVGSIRINTTTTTYATTSDYRLKENITEITDAIDRLKLLKPKRFNFICDPENIVDGFIAHEAQEVVPEAVTGEKDGIDWEGNPDYQGIDQSKLVPLLTAALQEAIAKIESLEQRISILENN